MRTTTVVIGAGHSGLAMSRCLSDRSSTMWSSNDARSPISWKTERWESLRLLTPNWQCRLPGHSYEGTDPDGFMTMAEVTDFITATGRRSTPRCGPTPPSRPCDVSTASTG